MPPATPTTPQPVVSPPNAPNPRVQALIKAAKEIARIAVLGALSALISYGATQVASLPPDSVYAIVLTVVLKGADKYLHENEAVPVKGLVPF